MKYLCKTKFKLYFNLLKKLDKHINNLLKCGLDIDSEIIKDLYKIMTMNIQHLQELMHDKNKTISWYIYENEWGKNKFTISFDKPFKKEIVFNNMNVLYNYLVKYNNIQE